jgi:hypothetical protein
MRWCWVPYQYYNIIIFLYMNASNKLITSILYDLLKKIVHELHTYCDYSRIPNNIIIMNVLNATCN